jgi:hypothetical protein
MWTGSIIMYMAAAELMLCSAATDMPFSLSEKQAFTNEL